MENLKWNRNTEKSLPGREVEKNAGERPEQMGGTIKRLMGYMKKSRTLILLTILINIVGTILQVLSPMLLGNATTLIFTGVTQGRGLDLKGLGRILLVLALFYVGTFITSFLQQRFMTLVSQKTAAAVRNELKAKMNRVPVSYFDRHPNGELMSVAVNDVDNIATALQQSLISLVSSVVLAVGVLAMMMSISLPLTVIACLTIPGNMLVMRFLSPGIGKYNRSYFASLADLNSRIEETFQGFTVIKSFNGEKDALEAFEKVNTGMYETGWKMRFLSGLNMPGAQAVQNIIYVFLAAAGAVGVMSGRILIGSMQAFLQYSSQLSQPIVQFSQIWGNLISMMASAGRVFEVLDAEEMSGSPAALPERKTEGAVKAAFDHVEFGYGDTPLMTGFTMDVEAGQMVAIVGHTGAGKTTLINLLERFYEIQGGAIRIDGVDIRNMSYAGLRGRIGMVLQDTWLFSGTIYDNIKFGNENATEEQIYAAARAAYADEFISKLPDGYGTVLGEDAGNISQGQRQLITIARAFVSDPEILILDEATSNVDSRTELIIQKAMKQLLKGRTSFVVAHRLSTIYDADRVLVMEKGNIVETGTHRELLGKNGVYADIYNSQFAGEAA
ncbi:ABC transporter ATP-binding protein [uncultured Clostridium sp.]|uniref:ABC transporter ATP-binding protein n=1 Tax=uncultured Clostridium sp. TaxID=59620 RepID=UPI0025D6B467|nr:ABC transporter ATP-binding protein [uncultured Clostridium sp.]